MLRVCYECVASAVEAHEVWVVRRKTARSGGGEGRRRRGEAAEERGGGGEGNGGGVARRRGGGGGRGEGGTCGSTSPLRPRAAESRSWCTRALPPTWAGFGCGSAGVGWEPQYKWDTSLGGRGVGRGTGEAWDRPTAERSPIHDAASSHAGRGSAGSPAACACTWVRVSGQG